MNKFREVKFRYDLLNQDEILKGSIDVLSGSVNLNSLAQIKRTARFTVKENICRDIDFLNDRIRPIAIINGKEYPLGNFLMSSPGRGKKPSGIVREIEAYDSSLILAEDKLEDRLFIPKGTKYTTAITQLVNSAYIFRLILDPSGLVLKRDREFEIGTPKLNVINQLLSEINYTSLYTNAQGWLVANNYVLPNMRQIDYKYHDGSAKNFSGDYEELKVDYSTVDDLDLFNIPNVWVVSASNAEDEPLRAVYRNESPTSPTSIPKRKRRIVDYRQVSDIADQSTLNNYVKRIAYNSTNRYQTLEFDSLINPWHEYSNVLYIEDKDLNIRDKFIETNWEIQLKSGTTMRHRVRRVVQI